jgi:hypothetical protein
MVTAILRESGCRRGGRASCAVVGPHELINHFCMESGLREDGAPDRQQIGVWADDAAVERRDREEFGANGTTTSVWNMRRRGASGHFQRLLFNAK